MERLVISGRVGRLRRREPDLLRLAATNGLPRPHDVEGRRIHEALLRALAERDAAGALRTLLRCAVELRPPSQVLAGWLPCLVALEEHEAAGAPFPEAERLRAVVVEVVRGQLASAPPAGEPLWVLPSRPQDAALAWMLAATLSRRGRPARPWLWDDLPKTSAFVTIGPRFDARRHNRPRCIGHWLITEDDTRQSLAGLFRRRWGDANDPLPRSGDPWRRERPPR